MFFRLRTLSQVARVVAVTELLYPPRSASGRSQPSQKLRQPITRHCARAPLLNIVFLPMSFIPPLSSFPTIIGARTLDRHENRSFAAQLRRDDEWMEVVLEVHCDIILRFVTPTIGCNCILRNSNFEMIIVFCRNFPGFFYFVSER